MDTHSWIRKVACFSLLGVASIGQASSEYIPVHEKALGQSLAGSASINDSLYSNPAASAFTQVYSLEASLLMPRTFSASVVDTRTSQLGGGLGYFRVQEPGSENVAQGVKLGLTTQLSNVVSIGLAGKALWGHGPSGVSGSLKDVDLGFFSRMQPVTLGVTFKNLFGGDSALGYDREAVLGASVNWNQTLFLSLAAHSKWGKWAPYMYGVGVQYVSANYFGLRGGYRVSTETGVGVWGVGAALLAPKLGLHYSVEFLPESQGGMDHMIAATLLL